MTPRPLLTKATSANTHRRLNSEELDDDVSSSVLHSAPANMLSFAKGQSLMPPSPATEQDRRRKSLMRKSLGSLMSAVDEDLAQWSKGRDSTAINPLEEDDESSEAHSESTALHGNAQIPEHSPRPSIVVEFAADETPEILTRSSSLTSQSFTAASVEDLMHNSRETYSAASFASVDSFAQGSMHGDHEGDAESDDSIDTTVGVGPRKRQKKRAQKKWGFEEQRAAAPSLRVHTSKNLASPSAFTVGAHYSPSGVEQPSEGQSGEENGQFRYYEFSPDLPPFAAGLRPKDLTGAGTWAGLVARAGSMNALQAHRTSLASTQSQGPVSMRQVAAEARWRQEQAKFDKERQANMMASVSLSPVDLLKHAESHASLQSAYASMSPSIYSQELASSRGSVFSFDNGSLYGSPSAVREDANSDKMSILTVGAASSGSIVGLGIQSPVARPEKVYAEVSMQTSPSNSPPTSPRPSSVELAELDEQVLKRQARALGHRSRSRSLALSDDDDDKVGASRRSGPSRRTSAASALSRRDLPELDWPMAVRVPRLSARHSMASLKSPKSPATPASSLSTRRNKSNLSQALYAESSDSEESDLDVGVSLDELAERSGVYDSFGPVRGAKRKLGEGRALLSSDTEESSEIHSRVVKPIRKSMLRESLVVTQSPMKAKSATDAAEGASAAKVSPNASPLCSSSQKASQRKRVASPVLGGFEDGKEDLLDDDGWLDDQLQVRSKVCKESNSIADMLLEQTYSSSLARLDGESSPAHGPTSSLVVRSLHAHRMSTLSADYSHGHSTDLHGISDQSTLGHGSAHKHGVEKQPELARSVLQGHSKSDLESSADASPKQAATASTQKESLGLPEAEEQSGAISDVTDTPDTAVSGAGWSQTGRGSRRTSASTVASTYSALSSADGVKEEDSPRAPETASDTPTPTAVTGEESQSLLKSAEPGASDLAKTTKKPSLQPKKSLSRLRAPSTMTRPRAESVSADAPPKSPSTPSQSPVKASIVPEAIPRSSLPRQASRSGLRQPQGPASRAASPARAVASPDLAPPIPRSSPTKETGFVNKTPVTPRKSLPTPTKPALKARPSLSALPKSTKTSSPALSRAAHPDQPGLRRMKSAGDLGSSALKPPSASSMPSNAAVKAKGLQTQPAAKPQTLDAPQTPSSRPSALPTPSSKKTGPRPSGLPTPSRI